MCVWRQVYTSSNLRSDSAANSLASLSCLSSVSTRSLSWLSRVSINFLTLYEQIQDELLSKSLWELVWPHWNASLLIDSTRIGTMLCLRIPIDRVALKSLQKMASSATTGRFFWCFTFRFHRQLARLRWVWLWLGWDALRSSPNLLRSIGHVVAKQILPIQPRVKEKDSIRERTLKTGIYEQLWSFGQEVWDGVKRYAKKKK